ncbi:hypothetical protein [Cohnella zeiphila]|uniref:Uncharacterized protein n=1 Tax=Cohnella zeiphila TaxID=2761120 RepID=A0A7X0SRX6_9BACL|nr:hypothetical protein [Cohnella zeiphila]MBB6734846.1 hypothetical protein [Cohnella zeiphila]
MPGAQYEPRLAARPQAGKGVDNLFQPRRPVLKSGNPGIGRTLRRAPEHLDPSAQVAQMQRTIGNQAVSRMLDSLQPGESTAKQTSAKGIIQRQLVKKKDEEGKFIDTRDTLHAPPLLFKELAFSVYEETLSNERYRYNDQTLQYLASGGKYFDPYYRALFSKTDRQDRYADASGQFYYYQGGYYWPEQTTDGMDYSLGHNQSNNNNAYGLYNSQPNYNHAYGSYFSQPRNSGSNERYGQPNRNNYHYPDDYNHNNFDFKNLELGISAKNRSEHPSPTKERDRPGTEKDLRINNHDVRCRLVSTEGSYHDIYEILSTERIRYNVKNNSKMLVRVPINLSESPTSMGMKMYRENEKTISVPRIYNNPRLDNLYLVERIPDQCDPTVWAGQVEIDQLGSAEKRQIEQIRFYLNQIVTSLWARGGTEPISDFRPANIRFRNNEQRELVLVDFSEEQQSYGRKDPGFAALLEETVKQFAGENLEAGTKANPHVYKFLTENFPDDLLAKMKNSSYALY